MARRWQSLWRESSKRWPQVVLVLILLGSLYQALCHAEAFVDDAAITFSYSQQLAATGELIHTASSERVEGFSNPTWTFLCAVPFLLSMDPYMFARALGLLALVATVLIVYRTGRLLVPRSHGSALLAAFFTAMAPCVPFWVMGGLETPIVGLLLAATVWQVIREEDGGVRQWSGLLLATLALTRPEGIMYVLPVALFKALQGWRRGDWAFRGVLRRNGRNLVLLVVPVAAYLLWRKLYFDAWLPNTYVAKLTALKLMQPDVVNLNRGKYYVAGFFEVYHLWPVLYAAPLVLAVRRRWAESLLVVAAVALHVAFVLWVDGDWMGDFRFFAMVMPLWGICLGLVLQGGADLISRVTEWLAARRTPQGSSWPDRLGRICFSGAAAAFVVFAFLPTLRSYSRMGWVRMELVRYQGTGLEMVARRAGLLRASIAVPDVGGSALAANVHVIDTVGLTDRVFATAKGRSDWIRRYFFEEARPDLFQEHGHWKRYFNLPRYAEFDNDYIMLPRERSKRMALLGDNYLRREHLTGWRGELDHAAFLPVGQELTLVAFDDAIETPEGLVFRLLVEVDPAAAERVSELGVELRGPGGDVHRADIGDLAALPPDLLRRGSRLRIRAIEPSRSVEAFRLRGPDGYLSEWLGVSVRERRAGRADLARFVLHPRSLFACGPSPSRWSPSLQATGRIQRFDTCRLVIGRDETARLVQRLRSAAARFLDGGDPSAAVALLSRAELLEPESWRIRSDLRHAARAADRAARAASREGDFDQARILAVSAIEADPLLPRARTLYLSLLDRGLSYSPDPRGRALTAAERMRRLGADEVTLGEALTALLAANRPLEAARVSYEHDVTSHGEQVATLAARAMLSVGLCQEALDRLPVRPRECRGRHVAHRARLACDEASTAPACTLPGASAPELRVLLDFDDGTAGLEEAGPIEPPASESRYVSGSVGPGLVRTDWAPGGVEAEWRGRTVEFEITEPGLSLQVGGGTVEDGVEVALVIGGEAVARASGERDSHLRRVTWDVRPWLGRRARLEISDRGSGEWGFLLVDHLRAHPLHYFDADVTP